MNYYINFKPFLTRHVKAPRLYAIKYQIALFSFPNLKFVNDLETLRLQLVKATVNKLIKILTS
jgi:hypothetical protein